LAAALLLMPSTSMAINFPVAWTTDNTLGANNVSLTVRLVCSGLLCGLVGFGSPYQQTQTSQLSGGGGGTLDTVTDTLTLDGVTGFSFAGSNVTFTGIPVFGNVAATNIAVSLLNTASGSIPGFELPPEDLQQIPTTLSGGDWYAYAETNNAQIPVIEITQASLSSPGEFREIGRDVNGNPLFELHDLRGAFQFLTATSVSGVTIRSTFRATFTLNLRGVGSVPEPGTFALLGGGIAVFAAAAARRRRSA
jgi:hypothetical protein